MPSRAAKKLFEEAMKLPQEERSLLAKQLLDSVDGANDGVPAEELEALEAALDESEREFSAGQGREFFAAIAELRARS